MKNTRDRLLEEWDEEDLECEIPLDQRTYEGEINRLYQLAKDIMTSAEIFDYLPTTKSGCFHKTKNILVADSKVKFWNEYGTLMMALKLKHQPYHAVITPVPKGNGNEMYLELDWFYLKPSEQSLMIILVISRNWFPLQKQSISLFMNYNQDIYMKPKMDKFICILEFGKFMEFLILH